MASHCYKVCRFPCSTAAEQAYFNATESRLAHADALHGYSGDPTPD